MPEYFQGQSIGSEKKKIEQEKNYLGLDYP